MVVGPYGPVGWWDGAAWRTDPPQIAGGEEYKLVRLSDPITTAVGGWGEGCAIEPSGPVVDVPIESDGDWRTPNAIGVTGVVEPRPRPVQVGDPSSGDYNAAAVQVVAGLGLDDPDPDIVQVVRADLDGDGTDEVLVTAERVPADGGLYAEAGNYSVVFLRQSVGGTVRTTVVSQRVAENSGGVGLFFMEFLRLAAVADLNGDGRMEIAINDHYYEGSGVDVHELREDGTAPLMITGMCGA